ncbi:WD repeat-containing protein 73-like [Penaeus chinensis]|uniref:WD repeat-containing protein 73-like n=1 Tax=Penaeus chinensis TaxID=139456 RepID=UPI001FB6843F|nr:WD repeat-containing protein 73-like [Penaeus chinensis]
MFDSAAESGDSEDEWFFQSIRRYEDLLMYDVQGVISSAVFRNDNRLLLASSREHTHEVWELSVPEKLTAGPDAGLTKDRDFKQITAGYTPDRTKEMLVINSKVVLSGPKSVCMYNIPSFSDPTDVMSHICDIRNDTGDATLAQSESCIYSATDVTNLTDFNFNTNKVSQLSSLPSQISRKGSDDALKISSIVYRSGKLYIGLSERGITYVYELGTGKVIQEITASDTLSGFWKIDISQDEKFVAFANSNGRVNVYDTRKLSEAVFEEKKEVQDQTKSNHQIHFSPEGNLLSLSGYSKLVEVFDVSDHSDRTEVFCHDGHRDEQISTILTHLWHPSQNKLVFSADDMGTLQAWRFK